jgi:hypothetical protein
MESFKSGRYPSGCPDQNHERQEVSVYIGIQMIKTFVSFVIFVVNDIRLSNSGSPQESLKTHKLKAKENDQAAIARVDPAPKDFASGCGANRAVT